jgi:hypothetical protein
MTEPDTNPDGLRDPFAPTPRVTRAPPPPDLSKRKARRFTVDQLKLVGIAAGAEGARAMLVDPRGKGWIVTRGELIGQPELVHEDGDHFASWRVDRVRTSDVVLVREDHVRPDAVQTRVLALPGEATPPEDDEQAL